MPDYRSESWDDSYRRLNRLPTINAPRVSLTPGAGRRTDQGRTCRDCGRDFLPTYGERYCAECIQSKGW